MSNTQVSPTQVIGNDVTPLKRRYDENVVNNDRVMKPQNSTTFLQTPKRMRPLTYVRGRDSDISDVKKQFIYVNPMNDYIPGNQYEQETYETLDFNEPPDMLFDRASIRSQRTSSAVKNWRCDKREYAEIFPVVSNEGIGQEYLSDVTYVCKNDGNVVDDVPYFLPLWNLFSHNNDLRYDAVTQSKTETNQEGWNCTTDQFMELYNPALYISKITKRCTK